jgi:hypothetical protein
MIPALQQKAPASGPRTPVCAQKKIGTVAPHPVIARTAKTENADKIRTKEIRAIAPV